MKMLWFSLSSWTFSSFSLVVPRCIILFSSHQIKHQTRIAFFLLANLFSSIFIIYLFTSGLMWSVRCNRNSSPNAVDGKDINMRRHQILRQPADSKFMDTIYVLENLNTLFFFFQQEPYTRDLVNWYRKREEWEKRDEYDLWKKMK